MSGHNKWSTIKHTKAKNDAANAKVFTKIGRELMVAVKAGGADPSTNPKLKMLMQKAKSANMPNDNVQRVIKKASGEAGGVNYEAITYEGYGPAGSAVIVYCLTDNKNRTASDVRHYFDKFGGSLGSTGCVSYMFNSKGLLIIAKGTGISDDDMMMHALEAGAEDVEIDDECFTVYTEPNNLDSVKEYFDNNGIVVEHSAVEMIPTSYVSVPEDKMASFGKLMDALNDCDDVQEVYHNVDNYEE
ncbi:MAG: YebC/PmpR family DNA-binding transcriptional regulator [Clostridiales bacterium]|nr:YebC/PmpR family DNA-binding transcriptional regulator [Clostridiales bacterium]